MCEFFKCVIKFEKKKVFIYGNIILSWKQWIFQEILLESQYLGSLKNP